MYYINLFFIFSVFGYIFETIIMNMIHSTYESGILFGPWTPVYGFGVLFILLIYNVIKKYIKKEFIRAVILFLLSAIMLSLIEFISGALIEIIFNKIYWNYETMKFNIGTYASLEVACIWGIASIILIYIIKPFIDRIIKYFPKWLSYLLIIIFIIDLVITIMIKL